MKNSQLISKIAKLIRTDSLEVNEKQYFKIDDLIIEVTRVTPCSIYTEIILKVSYNNNKFMRVFKWEDRYTQETFLEIQDLIEIFDEWFGEDTLEERKTK